MAGSGWQGLANIGAGVAKWMAAQGKRWQPTPVKKARKKISADGLANFRGDAKARWTKAMKAA